MNKRVIDLFAGCGGLSIGFQKAGFHISKALEFDQVIASTYKHNHSNVNLFVDDIQRINIFQSFEPREADIIIGGPPCQGFSMAGARIRNGFIDDSRNYLFKNYLNIVKRVQPDAFLMENVKGMLTMQNGSIFNEICKVFSNPKMLGGKPYSLFHKVIHAADFGIPQKRERLILVGVKRNGVNFQEIWENTKKDLQKSCPSFFTPVTIADAINNLPPTTKDGVINNPIPLTEYQKYLSTNSPRIYNHTNSNHSAKAVSRMMQIHNGENYTVLNERIKSVHSGAYGRLCWNEQAPTITTRFDTPAGGRFIHPDLNRTLSPREAARIQSFPDSFVFLGDKRSISRQIGNAVPPKLAFFLALFIDNILIN